MTEPLRVVVIGDEILHDAYFGVSEGGRHLNDGLASTVRNRFDGCDLDVRFSPSPGSHALRSILEDPSEEDPLAAVDDRCDIVIMSTTQDAEKLPMISSDAYEAMDIVAADITAVVDLVKDRTGAHVLVANTATFDPAMIAASLHGIEPEPTSLRAHRVDLVLLKLSHLLGISVIDIDRVTAEAAASAVVPSVLTLNEGGSRLVRDETVRILEDYGFFDERPIAPQIGNRKKSA